MKVREMVVECLKALGTNVSWSDADKWLNTKYGKGHGVRDTQYYGVRSEARQGKIAGFTPPPAPMLKSEGEFLAKHGHLPGEAPKPNASNGMEVKAQQEPTAAPAVEVMPEPVDTNEVTFAELRELSAYCKAHGGRERVRRVMRCLGDLLD